MLYISVVPKSRLGNIKDNSNPYAGGPNTIHTENCFLSMSLKGFKFINCIIIIFSHILKYYYVKEVRLI